MKKLVFIVASLMWLSLANPAEAQYSDYYYHRIGDTIEWKSEIGYYSWWEFQNYFDEDYMLIIRPEYDFNMYAEPFTFGTLGYDSNILLQRFYTPSPLKIIGIAGAQHLYEACASVADDFQEYYYIFDAEMDSFIMKAEVPWSPYDSTRTLHIQHHFAPGDVFFIGNYSCCYHYPLDCYIPITEYYFDTAIWVTDSFYVGGSIYSHGTDPDCQYTQCGAFTYYFAKPIFAYYPNIPCNNTEIETLNRVGLCTHAGVTLMVKQEPIANDCSTTFAERPWLREYDARYVPLIYPLIEIDTTMPPTFICDSITNVQVMLAGTSATVTWDDFPYYSRVQLKYGKGHPSTWQTIDVTGYTLYTLNDLEPSMRYGVQLMAECDTSKQVTPWTDPVYFYTGADTSIHDSTAIAAPTLLSSQTFLQPNPARNEVTVSSSFSLQRIELHDAAGILVYSNPAMGHQATVSLDMLRAGTYIVTIQTHYGTTHKRLVKQ